MKKTWLRRRHVALACALSTAGAFAFAVAAADAVLKYLMPDGREISSDKPVPGGRLEGAVQPQPIIGTEVAPASSAQPKDVDKRITARREAFEAARRELDAANAALAEAQQRLDIGREPLPGEYK